jgi:hypothetical protein
MTSDKPRNALPALADAIGLPLRSFWKIGPDSPYHLEGRFHLDAGAIGKQGAMLTCRILHGLSQLPNQFRTGGPRYLVNHEVQTVGIAA